ncbi:GGDEF domain-containing protein [Umezawaea sp. Da 62-37]|uniref:GGDEF domain-containing protein n=1 Tax=Umezawaea sp. Da 62-37 TaxID=3075927 RepID=UPI0028F6CEA9|nr:GGDEF domain-containing protein [Umezawaea sp. Da 62-37]WNV89312.1 GGDEF domain-containing protein [Umezawaea sp. Da 62-37]
MTLRRFGARATLLCTVLVLLVALVVSGVLGHRVSVALDKSSQLVFTAAAFAVYWRAAQRRQGVERRWRLWMTASMGALTTGLFATVWGQVVLGLSLTKPTLLPLSFILPPVLAVGTVLTLGFMLAPVLAVGAVLALTHGAADSVPNHRGKLVVVLDGLIVVGSLFVLTWMSALESMVHAWSTSGPGFAAVIAHPAAYLVLLVTLLVMSWTHQQVRRLPMLLLALGALAQSCSGWSFAWLVSHGVDTIPPIADAGFMACPVLLLLSALAPTKTRSARRTGSSELPHLLVPYLPLLVTGLFIVIGTASGVSFNPLEIYVGLGVVLLVIVRQLITLMDNARLVAQLHESQEQLRHQAFHDPLTGVANRELFRERLTAALRRGEPVVLAFIDVDGFKTVNDNYGHAEGDAVLRIVATRLQDCVRDQDTVARLGGDEFGVLVESGDVDPSEIGNRVLDALKTPHQTQGREHEVRASVGIAHRDDHADAVTADDMLGTADAAMYTAKRLGKGMVVVHGSVPELR